MNNPIDSKSITKVDLGQSCPDCPPGEKHRYVKATPFDNGKKVWLVHNKCGWGKSINLDWESYVKKKIEEGFVIHPMNSSTIIGQWDLKPWMFESQQDGISANFLGILFIVICAIGILFPLMLLGFLPMSLLIDFLNFSHNWGYSHKQVETIATNALFIIWLFGLSITFVCIGHRRSASVLILVAGLIITAHIFKAPLDSKLPIEQTVSHTVNPTTSVPNKVFETKPREVEHHAVIEHNAVKNPIDNVHKNVTTHIDELHEKALDEKFPSNGVYIKACRLYKRGLVEQAIDQLVYEIQSNPNNQAAKDLLEVIEGEKKFKSKNKNSSFSSSNHGKTKNIPENKINVDAIKNKSARKGYKRACELFKMGLVDQSIDQLVYEIQNTSDNQAAKELLEKIEREQRNNLKR